MPLYIHKCAVCGREVETVGYPAPEVTCCGQIAQLAKPARIAHVRLIRGNSDKANK